MTQALQQAIRDFAAKHPEYSTPEGSLNRCREASGKFCSLLRQRGFRAFVDEIKVVNGVAHKAVEVDGLLVDWTARQFHPEAAWPEITPA